MQVNHIIGKKITFCQNTYLKKILDHFKMTECIPAFIPIDFGVANFLLPFNQNADKKTIKCYQLAIRSFMWLAIYIYLDIAYSIEILSFYCSNSEPTYCNLIIQIFRYLFRTLDLKINFIANSEDDLVGYTEFNYAGFIDS